MSIFNPEIRNLDIILFKIILITNTIPLQYYEIYVWKYFLLNILNKFQLVWNNFL